MGPTYGGSANGMPRNLSTVPVELPTNVPQSNRIVGAAATPPMAACRQNHREVKTIAREGSMTVAEVKLGWDTCRLIRQTGRMARTAVVD